MLGFYSRLSTLLVLLCIWPGGYWPESTARGEIPADAYRKSLRHTGDVNDFAGILTEKQRESLEDSCRRLRLSTGPQLVVVIVPSLEGGEVNDFTNKLFVQWGVGQKGKNNGLLLLVAMKERKSRLEVGRGLEPVLPDVLAGRILAEQLTPQFRQQQYATGLTAAVNRVVETLERNEPAPPADAMPPINHNPNRNPKGEQVFVIGFLSLFVAVGGFVIAFSLARWTLGGTARASIPGYVMLFPMIWGLMFGGIPFIMGLLLFAPWGPVVHSGAAAGGGILGWLLGRYGTFGGRPWRTTGGTSSYFPDWSNWNTGWTTGSWSGGSWDGGGGGFSGDWGGFGGGDSGGGGASGSW